MRSLAQKLSQTILIIVLPLIFLSVLILSKSISSQATGEVGLWHFDEGADTTAADSSGNNNTGTLINGPVWTTGKSGNALQFDGVDDYVDAGNGASLNITNAITIEVWVKANSWNTKGKNVLVDKSSGDLDGYKMYQGYGLIGFRFWVHYSSVAYAYFPVSMVPVGEWHHLAGVWNGTNISIYLDGVRKDIQNGTFPTITAGNFIISKNGEPFNGLIDEVKIYNRALSADEVLTEYLEGNTIPSITPMPALSTTPVLTPSVISTPTPTPTPIQGSNTYYISPTGNNANTGLSIDQAWKSLAWAVANSGKVIAGTTIYMLNGTYYDSAEVSFYNKSNGTATQPINIKAYSGIVIIDGGDGNIATHNTYGLYLYGNSYITFTNIFFKNFWTIGKTYNSNHIIFNNMSWQGSDNMGPGHNSNLFNLHSCTSCNINNNSFYAPAGYTALDIQSGTNNTAVSDLYFNGIDGHPNIQVNENTNDITINDILIENSSKQGIVFYKSDTLSEGKNGTNGFSINNVKINTRTTDAMEFWSSKNGIIKNVTINNTGAGGAAFSLTSRNDGDHNENIIFYDTNITATKYIRVDDASNITFVRTHIINLPDHPQWRFAFSSSVYPANNITIRDEVEPFYTGMMRGASSVNIEYSDGFVFKLGSGSGLATIIGPNHYSSGSKASISHVVGTDKYFDITRFNMTARPISGSATVSVASFDTSLPIGSTLANFTADTTNGNNVTFTASTLKPYTNYLIKKGNVDYITAQADSTGKITFANSVWPSANFTIIETIGSMPTPTPTITPTPAPKFSADLNSDGSVNAQDFAILMSAWNSIAKPKADINQDGLVDSLDFGLMMSFWG